MKRADGDSFDKESSCPITGGHLVIDSCGLEEVEVEVEVVVAG